MNNTHISRPVKLLLLLTGIMLGAVSCHVDNYRDICDYKVQLRYDYNEENTTAENMIEYYVYTIDEYIFREDGILLQHRRFEADKCTAPMNSELMLQPGRYSVIAIGNQDERSMAWDARTGQAPVAGQTHRNDMRLNLDNAETLANGSKSQSERLYHGYKTFTVKEHGISRVRVDMVNAHFVLTFRVKWKNGASPERGSYYATLGNVPSEYALMPQYIYPAASFDCEQHDCDAHDLYPSQCNNVIHHIPYTCHQLRNQLTHRHDTYLNADNEVWGEFVNYRIKTATKPMLRLFRAADTPGGTDEMVLPNAIDLQAYFDWYHYELDYELKQEYTLDIIIDGNKMTITPLDVADWYEGGKL